jgi:hypothetical protein
MKVIAMVAVCPAVTVTGTSGAAVDRATAEDHGAGASSREAG